MKFVDMNDDRIYTLQDLKKDYDEFKQEEPWNHAETFEQELLEIIMATINGRNDLEIIDCTANEIERMIYRLRQSV